MKTTLDIDDLWDALEAHDVWKSWSEAQSDNSKIEAARVTKLRALTGGGR